MVVGMVHPLNPTSAFKGCCGAQDELAGVERQALRGISSPDILGKLKAIIHGSCDPFAVVVLDSLP